MHKDTTARPEPDMDIDRRLEENADLRRRLEEAEETIRAIQSGVVDALVVEKPDGHRIYTLEGADRPYRLMVEQMQQGAATLHEDGTIAYCNQRLAELLGVPHEKLIGRHLSAFVERSHRPMYEYLLRQGMDSSGRGEVCLIRAGDVDFPTYLTFNMLPEDCGATLGVLITDLTSQKHHEQLTETLGALRRSEQRFRSLVTATTSIVWTVDARGSIVAEQPSWAEYTGQSQTEYMGQGWLDAVYPDDLESVQERWEEALQAKSLYKADTRIWHAATGTYRHIEVRAVPVLDEHGVVREWIGRCMDVESQVQTEDQMYQLMAELKENDRRKNAFLAMLSHELRNPMAPLLNALQLLEQAGSAGAAEAREVIGRQVRHLSRLIDDLLEVSRISTGRIRLQMQYVSVNDVVSRTVDSLRSLVELHRQHLEVSLPGENLWLQADPIRLEQVFGNLLRNASKYNDSGGRIRIAVEQVEGKAVVRVSDSGIGMTSDLISGIFELFTQADTSLDHAEGGLGVGLALVKSLVEAHGGQVEARSEGPGRGSEFIVTLPLAEKPADHEHAPESGVQLQAEQLRILVVDDLADMARMTAMLLESWGHEVRVANCGSDALQEARVFHPDIILLDLGMPGMDGFEVAGRIRNEPGNDDIYIVAVTGYGQAADRARSREAGFNLHLTKPVEPDRLKRILTGKRENAMN